MTKEKLNVGDIKKALKDIPDNLDVIIIHKNEYNQSIGENVKTISLSLSPEKIIVIAGTSIYESEDGE